MISSKYCGYRQRQEPGSQAAKQPGSQAAKHALTRVIYHSAASSGWGGAGALLGTNSGNQHLSTRGQKRQKGENQPKLPRHIMIFSESSRRPDTPLEAWLQVWALSPAAQANNLNCSNREICQIIIRLASLSTKIQRIILVHSHSHRNVYVFRLKNFHPFSCLFRQDVVTQSHICIILPSFQILDVLKYDMN